MKAPQKRTREEEDDDFTVKKIPKIGGGKQQTESMAKEERVLEAKVEMQDEIIAQQKEATKLLHENGMLEEKLQMQDKVIA